MGSILSSYINVVRTFPLGSAIDLPWGWMEEHKLTEASVVYPAFDFRDESKIRQTAARFFVAIVLPSLAKPVGYANLGLGVAHLVCCICNIKKIHSKEEGYSPKEVEKAFIRCFTGIYDLAIGYLLNYSLIGRCTVSVVFALGPSYPIQLHRLIFEKAKKTLGEGVTVKTEIDHDNLKEGCFIRQFSEGLTLTFLPAPETQASRVWAIYSALGTWWQSSSAKFFPASGKPT